MTQSPPSIDRLVRFVAFSTLGVLSTTQELANHTLAAVEGGNPELLAEETLCFVATTTARAAEVSLRNMPEAAAAVGSALLELPFIYRDYLVGGEMIAAPEAASLKAHEAVYERLSRKQAFYAAHLPPNRFPGEVALTEKMALWMGRVSPPKQPELPTDRMNRLDLVTILYLHLRLVLAFGRREDALSR